MQGGSSRAFGIILFVLIGASALVLGVMNMGKTIGEPMKVDPAVTARLEQTLSGQTDIEALKNKDTDGDGLSDYDELYIYHTSPYIKDSDSDGIPDGTEVKNGTDPNCPQGKDCSVPAPIANTNDGSSADETGGSLLNAPVLAPTDTSGGDTAAMATQIRAMLKQQGMSDDMLNSFDDQTLVDMYNQSVIDTANSNSNTNQ